MIYAVMISIESGVFARDNHHQGQVHPRLRIAVLQMIQQILMSCGELGGPKNVHRLDFRTIHASVERLGPDHNHEDSVVIKPDGIFAKVEIPPEGPELLDWDRLRVVVDEN